MTRPAASLCCVMALGVLVGCGAATTPAETPAPELRSGYTGEVVSFDAMLRELAAARVVYLGEEHDNAADHALHARVLRGLYEHDPSLALGLEMFQRPFQPMLDDYVAGRIDEAALLARTEWESRWGSDFAAYRPMVSFARDHGLPVIALNAPREVTREVGRHGIDALSETARASLPELVLDDERHRRLVRDALGRHAEQMSAERLERMYQAQVIWDETMAESTVEALEERGVDRMVVVAGRMHVEAGLGIPNRAARRGAEPARTLIGIGFDEEREGRADYLFVR